MMITATRLEFIPQILEKVMERMEKVFLAMWYLKSAPNPKYNERSRFFPKYLAFRRASIISKQEVYSKKNVKRTDHRYEKLE